MSKTKDLLIKFLSWRIIVFLLAIPAIFILPIHPGFTLLSGTNFYRDLTLMWANFAGSLNVTLAANGQTIAEKPSLLQLFFPLYPWLTNILNIFIRDYVTSGLIISNIAFFVSLYLLYKLFCLDYKSKISKLAIILILIFPTSFFFGAVYPESILLLTSVLAFYFARKKVFVFASIFACLASLTSISGLFLWPAIAYEFYLSLKSKSISLSKILLAFIPLLGLISYIRTQIFSTGATFLEVINQAMLGSNQVVNKLILIHQVIFRYLKMIIFMDHANPLFFTVILESLVGIGFLILVIFSIKKIRPSYWLYCFLAYLLPTFTGTFSSFPRYVLVLFPLFGFLASFLERQHPYVRYLYFSISIILSIFAISLFTRGYFVA